MAKRAMDPALSRQALIATVLLCAVPSVAVAVFALHDAPASERSATSTTSDAETVSDAFGQGPREPSDTERSSAARSRDDAGAEGVRLASRALEHPDAPTAGGTEAGPSGSGLAEAASNGASVGGDSDSDANAERRRRFDEELAAGQTRPDLVKFVEASLAAQAGVLSRGLKSDIRCTTSVCEITPRMPLVGLAASASASGLSGGASDPKTPGATGRRPFGPTVARILIDTSSLGAPAAASPAAASPAAASPVAASPAAASPAAASPAAAADLANAPSPEARGTPAADSTQPLVEPTSARDPSAEGAPTEHE